MLFDQKTGWDNSKKLMNNFNAFIYSLKKLEVRNIKEKQIQKINEIWTNEISVHEVSKKSMATSIVLRYVNTVLDLWNS